MFKRFAAGIFLLAVMCGASWGATDYDPFHLSSRYLSSRDEQLVYSRYGDTEANFFYQLRDITGATRADLVAGPQWFATVYENYRYKFFDSDNNSTTSSADIYRRTMGGEIPEIPFRVVGDILDGFNFVFAEEPQPYSAWVNLIDNRVYDVYPDPLESLCLVITDGQGDFQVRFGNPYARHFPFWWNWSRTVTSNAWSWWRNEYDWTAGRYATTEPIKYIYSPSDSSIYTRGSNVGRYEKVYDYVLSGDHYYVKDLSGSVILMESDDKFYNNSGDILYTVSSDKVYNSSGSLAYTLESDGNGSDVYVCEIRNIGASVAFSGLENYYTIRLNPSSEGEVPSGSYFDTNVSIRSSSTADYGSVLGYLTFKQRASFATGYSNYREAEPVPVVIANVSRGNASDNPLIFDMIVFDGTEPVNRIKFTWDAQTDNTSQNLGTFFMIGSRDVEYQLETRITNRTGTRYMLYRYDMSSPRSNEAEYQENYRNILPDYWKYDITPDLYGTLPEKFLLDAHSQIAPGLVTVYKNNVGEGYRTISTQNDTSESFRLYEYASANPKNLRLNYRRIGGMTPITGGEHTPESGVNVREFIMDFADVASNTNQTAEELYVLTGKLPAMIGRGPLISDKSRFTASDYGDEDPPAEVSSVYINSSAIDGFKITKIVPITEPELVRRISEDTGSDTTTSGDTSAPTISNDSPTVGVEPADIIYTSIDIPLQPVSIRMRIPRQNQLIVNHWDEMDNAANSAELFNIFSRYGTVWVRSEATAEKDANLFTAINNKGNNLGVSAGDCVRAFIYDDELYLDFIVIMADGVSKTSGKTAYVEIFKDDNVPYILIGDGREDGIWDLTFYIASSAESDSTGGLADPNANNNNSNTNTNSNNTNSNGNTTNNNSNGTSKGIGGSSGGGGCSVSGMLTGLMLAGISLFVKFAKKR